MKGIKFISLIITFKVLLTINAFGQENLIKPDTLKCDDTKIISIVKEKPILVLSIDFTGDNKMDFICRIKSDNTEKGEIKELWIDHDYNIIKTIYRWVPEFDYYWFFNLDSDPEPEIFSSFGWTDGINYAFFDQDIKNGRDSLLFYFNPVIVDSTQSKTIFWGYPWDIKGIELKKVDGIIKVLGSIDHDIELIGEREQPDFQKLLPVICFIGKSTQPNVNVKEIRNITWMSIDELKNKVIVPKN